MHRRLLWLGIPAAAILLAASLVVGGRLWHEWRVYQADSIFSCRNHATFVMLAMWDHCQARGRLPYDRSLTGDRALLAAIRESKWAEAGTNCTAGAPMARTGGWQMVNASDAGWQAIARAFQGEDVPIVWCGRPHRRYVKNGEQRLAILLPASRLADIPWDVTGGQFPPPDFRFNGVSDMKLASLLARMNLALSAAGDPAVAIDAGAFDSAAASR